MKALMVALVATAGLTATGVANASAELAQKAGCMTCHAVDSKKMGPSFKDIAAKYKGNASAEADLTAKLKSAKGHPAVKASDADLSAIMKWVLAQ
jgi:cytochrome c